MRRQQHWDRPRQQEGSRSGDAGEQGNGQLDDIAVGATCDGKHDADQQYHRHVKEQRQGADQPGDTERVMGFTLAETFQQMCRNLIECADLMQYLAEHGAQRHDDRQKTQRIAHAFLHGIGDAVQRHAGKNTGSDRHQH